MKMRILLSIFTTLLLAGCAASSLGSHDKIVLTDAATRGITIVGVDFDAEARRIKPRRVVCAEPSPDIAKAVSSAIESSLKLRGEYSGASGALEGSLNRTFTESIAQLGSRLATIQLLRDELSDLCRAYANGAVSSITYTLRLSRLDKKMITLLVSEASAGALSRALVSINGSASAGVPASPEQLRAAETRISEAANATTEAGKTLSEASTKLNQATEDEAKAKARTEVSKAEDNLRTRLRELTERVLEKWALETRGSGLFAASTASAVAGLPSQSVSALDLKQIHRAYLDDDDLGTLLDACLTSMEDNSNPGTLNPEDAAIAKIQGDIDAKEVELAHAEAEANKFRKTRSVPTQAAQNPAEDPRAEEAFRKVDHIYRQLARLDKSLDNRTGARDRTGLLTFCRREGMENILRLIQRKVSDRYFLDSQRNYIDLCKAVVSSDSVPPDAKALCVHTLLRSDEKTHVEPSQAETHESVPQEQPSSPLEIAPDAGPKAAPDEAPVETPKATPDTGSQEVPK